MPDTSPLLPFSTPTRKHFLDNLRTTLTVLLVVHHALIETSQSINKASNSSVLALLVTSNKAFLWSTFFFISGHATSLSLAFRTSNLRVFTRKAIKVTTPAIIYAVVGQLALLYFLSMHWDYIFGKFHDMFAYTRLSGPVAYVLLLFIFDSLAIIIRQFSFPSWLNPNFSPRTTIFLSFIFLTIFTFLNAAYFVPRISTPSFLANRLYDTPTASFPASHIVAYAAGSQFKSLKRTLLSSSFNSALFGLVASITISLVSLSYAQSQWQAIANLIHIQPIGQASPVFIDGGLNAHTVFFSFWSSFTLFAIPISLLSTFYHASFTSRSWGALGRKTYIQTYIHMIPTLVALYHLKRVANVEVRSGLVVACAVAGSWMLAFIMYATFDYAKSAGKGVRRYMRW